MLNCRSSSEFWAIIPSLMQAWIRYYIPYLLDCLAAFANNSVNLLVSLRSNELLLRTFFNNLQPKAAIIETCIGSDDAP